MKKLTYLIVAGLILNLFTYEAKADRNSERKQNDTASYTTVTAKIIDQITKDPIVFASVYQTGTSIGTVTNSDGEFILKIPGNNPEGTISITHLGYKNKEVEVSELLSKSNKILLESYSIPIEELIVRNLSAEGLLIEALNRKKDNYNLEPEMQTGFYRETIKQNRNYVSISEAVLDIYNSGYRDNFDFDRIKIFKGRKSKDVKKMDTILVKFQGGPRTAMFIDLMKNPGVILDPDYFGYYDFKLNGIVKINDRDNYVIEFDQARSFEIPLYQGKVYVDVESIAITSVDFKLSDRSLKSAASLLVKKKPASMKIDVQQGHYLVNYRMIDGKWVLNYVRSEVIFKSKWDKKLFKSSIATMFEMAITDRDTENIDRFPYKVAVKFSDVLADQVEAFEDIDYWGEYNTIKPDESIEIAIKKLNKKLQR
jgi:hypothetical protein